MTPQHLAGKSRSGLFKKILLALIIYSVISMATIPFIDSVWIGEIPVLTVIQLPKTMPATLIRSYYAANLAKMMGISKGSFSPNYIVARPYALLIVYLLPLSVLVSCYA
ncbi:MAG: hypothetical protein ABFR90_09165, partial [Planctomycetota bacterium]